MKPANISFKKYRIKMIVSPATFYAIEYGKEAQFEMKSKILQRDVKPFDRTHEISIGQIVAVKYENGFHRGLITDTYNRCKKPVYCIWLMDNDSNIEVSADSVYMIKTSELRDKKLSISEITLYGVQPGTIDLLISSVNLESNTNRNNLNGILHLRESDKWSLAAFKFVKELFKSNKCIYVNCIDTSGSRIVGNIYYKQEGHDTMMSLAQTLFDKNFAVFSRSREKIPILDDFGDGEYLRSIERRIPKVPNMEWEELYSQQRVARNNSSSGNLSSFSESSKSFFSDQEKILNDIKEEASTSCSSFSPSPILEKVKADSSSASSVYFTSNYQNSKEKESSVAAPKICLLRIIQRNLELYKKHNLEC